MAKLMTSPDETEFALVDLSEREYQTIRRALEKALERARELSATADEHDIVLLLNAIDD